MLEERLKCKQVEEKIQSIQRELKINNQKVGNSLNEGFIEIISSNSWKMTPLMKLFWEQQSAYSFCFFSWACYHPVIFSFC